ncbi:MAG: hypothetical protein H6R01_936 [Burkholderiaceae bacterium]|nr:hypothetical protein [Burkholderiaceae bacterium]
MTVSADQQAALEKPIVRVVYFVSFNFAGGVGRFSTFNQPIEWDGANWLGVGAIASISEVTEEEGATSSALNFTLNAGDPQLLALAVGPVEEYRGRSAKMWMCPLDDAYRMIGSPEVCWRGIMDAVTVGVDGDKGSITLKCETSAYGLKRRPALRMNAAQQKKRHPEDTGFAYLSDLIANPSLWLSKKFQAQ